MYPIIHQHSDTSSFLINRSGSFQSNLTAYITPTSPILSPANPAPYGSPLMRNLRSLPSIAPSLPQQYSTAIASTRRHRRRRSIIAGDQRHTGVVVLASHPPISSASPPSPVCSAHADLSLPSASPTRATSSISSAPPSGLPHRSAPPEQMLCR